MHVAVPRRGLGLNQTCCTPSANEHPQKRTRTSKTRNKVRYHTQKSTSARPQTCPCTVRSGCIAQRTQRGAHELPWSSFGSRALTAGHAVPNDGARPRSVPLAAPRARASSRSPLFRPTTERFPPL